MSDYWLKRALADEARAHQLAKQTTAELKKVYQRQYQRVYTQMERLYGQIDWGDTLTRTQLWQYSRWKTLEQELRSFATQTPRIGIDKITSCLDKVFAETIGADISRFSGAAGSVFRASGDALSLINTAWSGESFSARIWKNTATLAERIRSGMEDMLVSGRSLGDIKYQLMQDFSVGYNDASRLVQTEAAYVMNGAAKQRYKSAGIGKVRWSIAPEDGRECEICKARANKVWHIENAPPMPAHPRCRCVWVAVVELPGENVPCTGEGEEADGEVKLPEKLEQKAITENKIESEVNMIRHLQSNKQEREMAGGGRRGRNHQLSEDEKKEVLSAIKSIQASPEKFIFEPFGTTGYLDSRDVVIVAGNVMPDLTSTHPRDRMSMRAVLAHEYYGHRMHRGTKLSRNSWNDEFRASYTAAKIAPGLTDEERRDLVLDALERAKEAGVVIKLNETMKRILYGY